MDPIHKAAVQLPDVMNKLIMGLAVACIVLLTPFALNSLLHQQFVIAITALIIIALFTANAACILRRGHYYSTATMMALAPLTLFFIAASVKQHGMVGILWSFPAVLAFYLMLPERKAWLANLGLLVITAVLIVGQIETVMAIRIFCALVMVSIFSAIFVNVISELQHRLKTLAVTDPLTGAYNRAYLEPALSDAILQSNRTDLEMSLVTLNLDHFKVINDQQGLEAGDAVLKSVATLLKQRSRAVDRIFRVGGEEFLVLLYGTCQEGAKSFAEEISELIASTNILPNKPITISAGVATLQSTEGWREWMGRGRVDRNLNMAKNSGRNQVIA